VKILVVDDDPVSRRILERRLSERGYPISTAPDGNRAWEILLRDPDIRMVLADWMMPGLKGPELCRRIREHGFPWYTYVILVTARTGREDIIEALDLGADDYMTKPFDMDELHVRIQGGLRIIHLNERLRAANEIMRRDLESGRAAQRGFLPRKLPRLPDIDLSARFIPSRYLSGDMYNILRLDEFHVGLMHIDVSGHGVSAALFSVRIGQNMNNDLYPKGLLKTPSRHPPFYEITPPERVARRLDSDDLLDKHEIFFTMLYAVLHLESRTIEFHRAGHNRPLLIRSDGNARFISGGGAPIGMGIPNTRRRRQRVRLSPGDAFIVYSDGLNEAVSGESGESYGHERIRNFLAGRVDSDLSLRFDSLIEDVQRFQGGKTFGDDLSILGLRILPEN